MCVVLKDWCVLRPGPLNLQIYKNRTMTCEGGDREANLKIFCDILFSV